MMTTYKVKGPITLPFVAIQVYTVEVYQQQCCGKPEVKVMTSAYFTDKDDAERFVVLKNIQFKESLEAEAKAKAKAKVA